LLETVCILEWGLQVQQSISVWQGLCQQYAVPCSYNMTELCLSVDSLTILSHKQDKILDVILYPVLLVEKDALLCMCYESHNVM